MTDHESPVTPDPLADDAVPADEIVDAPAAGEGDSATDSSIPNASPARLVVKRNGAETQDEFAISPPATIGRFDPAVGPIDVDLASLPEGSYVSRKHAKITCEDGIWQITDLGSSNGTFLLRDDFERVETGDLSDGQEIALGNARFVFHLDAADAVADEPA